jgi:hypothetical protein
MAQTGELAKFDHPGRERIFFGQPLQGLVQDKEIMIRVEIGGRVVAEFDTAQTTAPLLPRLVASRFNQDPAHRLGGGSEEVAPSVPVLGAFDINQAKIGLMDQGRGLKCLAWLLPRQLLRGQLTEFLIDQRQELLGSPGISLFDRQEDVSYVVH